MNFANSSNPQPRLAHHWFGRATLAGQNTSYALGTNNNHNSLRAPTVPSVPVPGPEQAANSAVEQIESERALFFNCIGCLLRVCLPPAHHISNASDVEDSPKSGIDATPDSSSDVMSSTRLNAPTITGLVKINLYVFV